MITEKEFREFLNNYRISFVETDNILTERIYYNDNELRFKYLKYSRFVIIYYDEKLTIKNDIETIDKNIISILFKWNRKNKLKTILND